ncbi:MAG TPA: type II toxin-antitoxin system VapC family toxin [Acidobacteriota bacterium]|nr:type II toxin-antitoxin system VapC family toxin [Acidobacteriota bacterium]
MKILLDTNAYAALMRGETRTADRVRRAARIFLSAIVAGELVFGFRNGSRFEKNMRDLETFLENAYVEFLPVSLITADRFGRIAASLRRKGTPLPTNDIWIAAHAMESGAELLSFDRHFELIEGLVWTRL